MVSAIPAFAVRPDLDGVKTGPLPLQFPHGSLPLGSHLRAAVRNTECNLACDVALSGHIDRRIEPPADTPDRRGPSSYFSVQETPLLWPKKLFGICSESP
jgi:hypothetical protein